MFLSEQKMDAIKNLHYIRVCAKAQWQLLLSVSSPRLCKFIKLKLKFYGLVTWGAMQKENARTSFAADDM